MSITDGQADKAAIRSEEKGRGRGPASTDRLSLPRRHVLLGGIGLAAAAAASPASAQSRPASFAELALYKGADRDRILLEGARKEGRVMWYTSYVLDLVQPMVTAFKAAYPGIEVEFWRGTDLNAGTRVITEYRAGRHDVDAITVSGTGPSIIAAVGGQRWDSPYLADYPIGEMGRDPGGMLVTINQYARAFAYNTSQVAAADVPTQWEDLLKPRWRGKMAFSTSATVGPMMIGGLIDLWGRDKTVDFVKRLGEQQVATLAAGPAAVLSRVASGDFDGCYGAIHHVEALQAKGAPVKYSVLGDTVFAPVQTTQLPLQPKNPHAALLFTDFLIRADGGQRVMKEHHYLAAHPKVAGEHPALAGRKLWVLTPERMEAGLQEWTRIMRQYLR